MIKALLVDDEPRALKTLQLTLEKHCPEVEILGTANNIVNAFKIIIEKSIDLIFLDISMPNGSGLDLQEKIKEMDVKVIFTTAHKEHAISALRLDAIDYLLKPIDKSELKNAINRYFNLKQTHKSTKADKAQSRLTIHTQEGVNIIDLSDILYVESDKNYSIFHLANNDCQIASKPLGTYEDQLKKLGFFRIHRSCIVNLNQISKIKRGKSCLAVLKNNVELEISKSKKDQLLEALNNF
ncbi:two component transcriptional regulator, LytTR family [Ekhidna lutea]|uniref:Two component transcriptional regulator, LytTR family n=1 Tax=Ekhidna lutea TaxID=447679 RepID=A0A239H3X5_EKHLU|nr:LytTR family DNA-binding domain-containing protein [Ekhidna lutea]SNS76099.1 two component transcriptional regulator, LytTR family [Ekhidna lutea]